MKSILTRIPIIASVACMALATHLGAVTILTTADALGYVFPGAPANPTDEVGYINTLIDQPLNSGPTLISGQNYTRTGVHPGALPDAVTTDAQKDDTSPSNTVNITGFEYILGKYDGQNAGSFIWYVGDITGDVEIPSTALGHELSHWSLYNATGTRVPDGGMTVALLGLSMTLIAVARRKFAV